MEKNTTLIAMMIGIVVIVALGVAAWGGSDSRMVNDSAQDSNTSAANRIESNTEFSDEEISSEPDNSPLASDILDEPENFVGQTVTVRTEVEEWIAPHAFALDASGVVNDRLLVLSNNPQYIFEDSEVFGDDVWEVQGTVRMFKSDDFADSAEIDTSGDLYDSYEDKPYIDATLITQYDD